jgi:hypothetical protein
VIDHSTLEGVKHDFAQIDAIRHRAWFGRTGRTRARGHQRFETFMDVLRQLQPDQSQAAAAPVEGTARQAMTPK